MQEETSQMMPEMLEADQSELKKISGESNSIKQMKLDYVDEADLPQSANLVTLGFSLDTIENLPITNRPTTKFHKIANVLFSEQVIPKIEKLNTIELSTFIALIKTLPDYVGTNYARFYRKGEDYYWFDSWFDREGFFFDFAYIPSEKILAIMDIDVFETPEDIEERERLYAASTDELYHIIRILPQGLKEFDRILHENGTHA